MKYLLIGLALASTIVVAGEQTVKQELDVNDPSIYSKRTHAAFLMNEDLTTDERDLMAPLFDTGTLPVEVYPNTLGDAVTIEGYPAELGNAVENEGYPEK